MSIIKRAIEIVRDNNKISQSSRSERRENIKKERFKKVPLSGKIDQSHKKK